MIIEYVQSSNTFHINCKIYENDLVRKLPNRKFVKKLSCWVAPAIKINARVMEEEFYNTTNVKFSDLAKEKIKQILEGSIINKELFPPGFEFKFDPFDYQLRALNFGYSMDKLFYNMDPGLGKSKILIDKLSAHRIFEDLDAVVILCPKSIIFNWIDQIRTHISDTVKVNVMAIDGDTLILNSDNRIKLKSLKSNNGYDFKNLLNKSLPILIVAIESLSPKLFGGAFNVVKDYLMNFDPIKCAVAIDEAHNIKGHKSNRTNNAIELGKLAKYRILMTGTPISEGTVDLYSQFEFLDPNIIGVGDYYSFSNRYINRGEYNNIIGYKNIDELIDTITPFVFTCRKADVLSLPEKSYEIRKLEMNKDQKILYDKIKKDGLAILSNDTVLEPSNVLVLMSMLQQISGGFINYKTQENTIFEHLVKTVVKTEIIVEPKYNPKIIEVINIIQSSPKNTKFIVWCKFRLEIDMICEELKRHGISFVQFHGGISLDERNISVNEFEHGQAQCFVVTQRTGGAGLTLNAASSVIYYSNEHPYLLRAQSEDRNHRIGQNKSVIYYDLEYPKSVDSTILKSLTNKQDLFEYVQSKLSNNQVLEY